MPHVHSDYQDNEVTSGPDHLRMWFLGTNLLDLCLGTNDQVNVLKHCFNKMQHSGLTCLYFAAIEVHFSLTPTNISGRHGG